MATLIKRVGEKPVDGKRTHSHCSVLLTDDEVIEKRIGARDHFSRKVALTNSQKKRRIKSKAAKQARKKQR